MFISLEGGEGSGKSIQITKLKQKLEDEGHDVRTTREPGGAYTSERIRDVLFDDNISDMSAETEFLLYTAARHEHIENLIKPALDKGETVISDRFIDSSTVYQGIVKGVPVNYMKLINGIFVSIMPDVTFFLDIEPEIGLSRIGADKGREVNRFDQQDISFHKSIRAAYQDIKQNDHERIAFINADQPPDDVTNDMYAELKTRGLL